MSTKCVLPTTVLETTVLDSPHSSYYSVENLAYQSISSSGKQISTCKSYPEYIKHYKEAMKEAYDITAEKAGIVTSAGRDVYNKKVCTSDLKPDDRVLLKNVLEKGGPGKLRSFWEDKIYIVLNGKDPLNAIYEVLPESQLGRTRVLHRNLLLSCPFLPSEEDHGRQSIRATKTQNNNTATNELKPSVTANEFTVEDSDDLPSFSSKQLQQVGQHFTPRVDVESETTAESSAPPVDDRNESTQPETDLPIDEDQHDVTQPETDLSITPLLENSPPRPTYPH